jgi:hypothetical protein
MNLNYPSELIAINDGLLKEVAIQLANYSVSFVEFYEHLGQEYGHLCGSGTLVSIDGNNAILTAAHVLEVLQESREIGIILGSMDRPQLHRFTLSMESSLIIRIPRGDIESYGPDLGLLCILGTQVINSINAIKSFANLSKRRNQILSYPLAFNKGVWYLCGMIDEMTSDAPREAGQKVIKKFRGICDPGEVTNYFDRDNFDYLDFKVHEACVIPKDYRGVSGGGLWQVIFDKDHNGKTIIKDRILSGVAFYQSDPENDKRTIRCHGQRSIYGLLLNVFYNGA